MYARITAAWYSGWRLPNTSTIPRQFRSLGERVIPLFTERAILAAQPPQLFLLRGGQPALAPPVVTVGPAHPVPDALGRRLKLARQLFGRTPLPH
jgi:hypothetical protein